MPEPVAGPIKQIVAESNLSTVPQSVAHGELAAMDPLQRVLRVNMVMAELWSGPRTGRFDVPMIERQLARTDTPKP
ncbi:MAG: homoserine kinase type [Kribbellaceae bacterium]|nr:homoserine kinase type [Kribbellaceae bacterium]